MNSSIESEQPGDKYEVLCYNCGGEFDALDTVWCRCLVSSQTLVCPSCLHCFCKSPHCYMDAFWTNAPQSMWDRKMEHENEQATKANPDPDSLVHPLVLVIDEQRLIRNAAGKAVESLGYSAIFASDGLEGLALARKYKPDLILSEMLMPKMDGMQMCRFIKSDAETANIRVVLMTSLYTKLRHKSEIYKHSHPDDFLSKPLEFQQLGKILRKHLGQLSGV